MAKALNPGKLKVKETAGWTPETGDLVREKIPNKEVFGPAYRDIVPVLGVKGARTVIFPPLPGSKKK